MEGISKNDESRMEERNRGMRCPMCEAKATKIDTLVKIYTKVYEYQCDLCGARYFTSETVILEPDKADEQAETLLKRYKLVKEGSKKK